MAAGEAPKQMTAVFNCNLREFVGNPHLVETEFGTAQIVGIGNAFDERDGLEQQRDDLLDALIHIEEYWNRSHTIGAMEDALREIVDTAQRAIAKITSVERTESVAKATA